MDSVTPVDRIVLSSEYDITGRWTVAAYTALCERSDPLTYSEASRLGLETSVRVAQMRDRLAEQEGIVLLDQWLNYFS